MSADLYNSDIDEEKYGSMSIETNVHGTLYITNSENDKFATFDRDDVATFILPPNEEGFKEAKKIIAVLEEWMKHNNAI